MIQCHEPLQCELPGVSQVMQASQGMLVLPFDALRWSYTAGVQAGYIQSSMLASRDFEKALGILERMALGPLARSV